MSINVSEELLERRRERIRLKKEKKQALKKKKLAEIVEKTPELKQKEKEERIALKKENKKMKKLSKKKEKSESTDKASNEQETKKRKRQPTDDDPTLNISTKKKKIFNKDAALKSDSTLFIGQIPFNASEDDLKAIFDNFSEVTSVNVRFLTDKRTKKFRGMAFVEVGSPAEATAALNALHHTVVKGRRINIERTVPGKSKSVTRKDYLLNLNSDRNLKLSEKKKSYLENLLNDCVGNSKVTLNDLDERAGSAVCTLPRDNAKDILEEWMEKRTRVRNPIAFLMGMLKNKRGDTPEGEPLTKKAIKELGSRSGLDDVVIKEH